MRWALVCIAFVLAACGENSNPNSEIAPNSWTGAWAVTGPLAETVSAQVKSDTPVYWLIGSDGRALVNTFRSQSMLFRSCVDFQAGENAFLIHSASQSELGLLQDDGDSLIGIIRNMGFRLTKVEPREALKNLRGFGAEKFKSVDDFIRFQCAQ